MICKMRDNELTWWGDGSYKGGLTWPDPSQTDGNFSAQHNKALVTVQREVAALLYRYLCTTTTMHYSKTPGQQDNARDRGEGSHIMTLSEGIEDLR